MNNSRSIRIKIVILILLTGCTSNGLPDCEDDQAAHVNTFYADEVENVLCAIRNNDSEEKKVNLIITNQAELEKYFSCYERFPSIDFETFFVLAGSYTHHQCAFLENQQVSVCDNSVIYKVRLLERDCQSITSIFYAVIIENKYNGLPVNFDVGFID